MRLNHWLERGVRQFRDEAGDGEGEGSGAGGGGGVDETQKRIDEATSGLKKTNAALKEEKVAIKKQLDELTSTIDKVGGADGLKRLTELNERLQKDELGKLLADGKTDEWFDRRTESLRKNHQSQLDERDKAVQQANERAEAAEKRLHRTLLRTEVATAAAKAGVETSAIEDIELRAERAFQFDTELQQLVMRNDEDGVVYGKDGKAPKSVAEWLDDQKEVAKHWWPPSTSGGASGNRTPGRSTGPDLEKMSPREYAEHMDKLDRERRRT